MTLAAVATVLALVLPRVAAAQDGRPVVMTEHGPVRGVVADGVAKFLGIPYAAPPVAGRRWSAPAAPAPWTEARDASAFGSDCMQAPSEFETLATTPSEDCLYVNVWRPAGAAGALPVMVWLHGGGFVGGGSSSPIYDGSAFARQGVVLVSLNYRLSRLGFFAHPALIAGEPPLANFGYMDQLAALRWVRRNVAAFGGDPDQVTLAGESAGGASVLTWMTTPLGRGLFHQAVVMSGGGRHALATRAMRGGRPPALSADAIDGEYARSLGIEGGGPEALAALRARAADSLVAGLDLGEVGRAGLRCVMTAVKTPPPHPPCAPLLAGTPVVDGTIVTGMPGRALASGEAPGVPIIVGTTAAEVPEVFPPSLEAPYEWFGNDARAARAHYRPSLLTSIALAIKDREDAARALPLLSMSADMTMHEPARFVARQVSAQGRPAWLYRFSYTAQSTRPGRREQTHAGELPFLFETLTARYGNAVSERDRAIAQAFNRYVVNFVKHGDPNGPGLPRWPAFDAGSFRLMDFAAGGRPRFRTDPRARGVQLVERAADAAGSAQAAATGRR
jgi:para-nitrobenzyl esterase